MIPELLQAYWREILGCVFVCYGLYVVIGTYGPGAIAKLKGVATGAGADNRAAVATALRTVQDQIATLPTEQQKPYSDHVLGLAPLTVVK